MSSYPDYSTFDTREVHQATLDNGLEVLMLPRRTAPIVSCMIWYRVGSRNERAGETGRSHFLEHMLFKGTKRYGKGEIDLLTMKHGGTNNAFTSSDFTAYYFSFAADRWEAALEIEADRMVNTIFDTGEFEAERQVIIEELKGRLDQPWGQLMQDLNATAYQRHPYRNPVIGWLEDLEAVSLEGVRAYYDQHYHPANAILVLVGDFEIDSVFKKVEARFESIPGGEATRPEPGLAEPEQTAERRIDLEWRSDIPRLAIGYHAPRINHADSYPLHVLAAVVAEGKTSRLYQRLVEREQSTTFVTAEYSESADPTLFCIRAEAQGEASVTAIEASIYEELSSIASKGILKRELERVKHQIEAHFIFSMERTLDQAILLGQVATLDELSYVDRYIRNIGEVDSAQVAEVCGRYLCETNRTVARQRKERPVPPEACTS